MWPEKDPPEPGERYTTDRRHVLGSLQSRCPAEPRSAAEPAPAVRGISEARIIEKTGHGFAHWFDVLDRFGAVKRGHTAAARHLYEAHGVPGWHAQGITVAYERARGVRAVNQRCDGLYEVSVSTVVAADVAAIIKALATPRQRARLEVSDPDLMRALAAAVDARASEGFVVRPDGLGRFRYKWGETTVQFHLVPKAASKVSIVVTSMNLASGEMVERRRAAWREMLNSLAALVAPAATKKSISGKN